jgi:hypothetical protein
MTILKTVLACVGATILSFNAMAATPKGDAKSETTASTVVKSEATLNTYYVNRINPSDNTLYDISTTPNANCGDGSDSPCEFQTSQTLGATIAKSSVDNEVNLTITDTQAQLH